MFGLNLRQECFEENHVSCVISSAFCSQVGKLIFPIDKTLSTSSLTIAI